MSGSHDGSRCDGMETLLHALADGELDAANALGCEAHLDRCGRCATAFAELRATREVLRRDGVRHRAPERLRARVRAAMETVADATPAAAPPSVWLRRPLAVASAAMGAATAARRHWWRRSGVPALALAAGLAAMVFVITPPFSGSDGAPDLRREVVAGHVRSLLGAGHLTDVASSDHHTVKPWFAGRLDFSPPAPDLADAGYPLAGGRLDYLDGRTVAALVYRRREHVINVFVWPDATPGTPTTPRRADTAGTGRDSGYAVLHWTADGMTFWAVSDLNAAELADFVRVFGVGVRDPTPPS